MLRFGVGTSHREVGDCQSPPAPNSAPLRRSLRAGCPAKNIQATCFVSLNRSLVRMDGGAGLSGLSGTASARLGHPPPSQSFEPMSDLPQGSGQQLDEEWTVFGTRVAYHDVAPTAPTSSSGVPRRPTDRVRADGRGAAPDGVHQHAGRLRDGLRLLRQRAQGGRAKLSADEILEQVLHLRNLLPPEETVSHVVVMGMGESLANLDNLIAALDRLCSAD